MGQTVDNWKELVTSHSFARGVPLRNYFKQVKAGLSREGMPVAEDFRSRRVRRHHSLRMAARRLPGLPAAARDRPRATRSGKRMLVLSFVEKTTQLSPEKRNAWLKILKDASIQPADGSGP